MYTCTCTLHPSPSPSPPLPPPSGLFFLVRPETAYAPLGTNASFTCSGTSSTTFFIFWRRNGIQFSTDQLLVSDGISYENSANGNVVSSELTVPTLVENNGTSFTCLLSIPTVVSNLSNPVQLIILGESIVGDCARVCGCGCGCVCVGGGGVGVSTRACVS